MRWLWVLLAMSLATKGEAAPIGAQLHQSREMPSVPIVLAKTAPIKPTFDKAAARPVPRAIKPAPRLTPPRARVVAPRPAPTPRGAFAKPLVRPSIAARTAKPRATRRAPYRIGARGQLRPSFQKSVRPAKQARLPARTAAGVRKPGPAFNTRGAPPRRLSPAFRQVKAKGFARGAFRHNAGYPHAAGRVRTGIAKPGQVFYRVYSGGANRGQYATIVRPKNSSEARQSLALPPGNRATRIQRIVAKGGERYTISRVAPMKQWGRRGGGVQVRFHDKLPNSAFKEMGWLKGGLKTLFTDSTRKSPLHFFAH